MTESKPYIINPDEWEYESETCYLYEDSELAMRVILEQAETDPTSYYYRRFARPRVWYLKAESTTYTDSGNCFYYDALEPGFTCQPYLKPADKEYFFDDDDELKPIELPAWLIKHMQWLADDDVQATCDFDAWSKECDGETFADYNAMRDSLTDWYKREYPQKDVDPFFIDLILTIGNADYCIGYDRSNQTYTVNSY